MIHFDIANLKVELVKLENLTNEPNFWGDVQNSTFVVNKLKVIKNKINKYNIIESKLLTLKSIIELLQEEFDEDLFKELSNSIKEITNEINKLEIDILLSEKYDRNNAILTLHPGAGGTEARRLGRNAI